MQSDPASKYVPFPPVFLPDRQWPGRTLTHAPIWCSVDLRDGNQALAQPMSVEEKIEFFEMLVRIGFKEIEVGFPSASQIEFDFTRRLIEGGLIPDDVAIQVLCQCREELITRTLEAVRGREERHLPPVQLHLAQAAGVRLQPAQARDRRHRGQGGLAAQAESAGLVASGTRLRLEYSPESFTSTSWSSHSRSARPCRTRGGRRPTTGVILNLPATVEYATPNVHADQIEWMCRRLTRRASTIVSLHTHNDRGTGVAATELALLAGADRVEGTLFGNGERTGNLDIVTVALNLYTQASGPASTSAT